MNTFETGAAFVLKDDFSNNFERLTRYFASSDEKMQALIKTAGLLGDAFSEAAKQSGLALKTLTDDVGRQSKVMADAMKGAFGSWDGAAKAGSDAVLVQISNMQKGVLDKLSPIEAASKDLFVGMGDSAFKGAEGVITQLDRINAAVATSMRGIAAMSAEMAKMGIGSSGNASLHRRSSAAHGVHVRAHGVSIPGGHIGGSGDGTLPLVAGLGMLDLVKGAVNGGLEMEQWSAQMKGNGFTDAQIAAAKKASWANAAGNANASVVDSMKSILELNKVTGNFDESLQLLPIFSQASTAIGSIKAEDLKSKLGDGSQILNFARGLEELGVTQMGKTPEEREKYIKQYEGELLRTMQNSRGLFDGNALYALTNNSGGAAQNWDMRMATTVAPIISEVMKAGKAGNADYMAIKSYAGGHITSDAVQALMSLGLTADGDTYENKTGWHLKANSQFAEGMSDNIWDWSSGVIAKLKARGVNVDDQETMNKIVNEIGSNKSTSALMRMVLEPRTRGQIQKEMDLRDKVPGDVAGILQANDPLLKIDALKKSWSNFEAALGSGGIVDTAIGTLNKLTTGLTGLSQFLEAHPEVAKIGVDFAAIGGGILTVVGAIKMLGLALPGGVGGVQSLAGAAGAASAASSGAGINILAKSVTLFGLAGAAQDSHIFDDPKRSGWRGVIEGLDPGIANWLFKKSAFITGMGGGMGGEGSPLAMAVRDGFLAAFAQIQGGSMSGGGMGGGSGLINASWEGGSLTGGGLASSGDVDSVINRAGLTGFNTRGVKNMNIGNIGWGSWAKAHGAIGGAGSDTGHLVAVFPSFEAGAAAAGALALGKYGGGARSIDQLVAGAHGWTPGNHAAAANIARMMGISPFADAHLDDPGMMAKFKSGLSVQELGPAGARYARDHMRAFGVTAPPARRVTPGSPGGQDNAQKVEVVLHNHTHLNGREIHKSVVRQIVAANAHPRSVGGPDWHGTYQHPGSDGTDVA